MGDNRRMRFMGALAERGLLGEGSLTIYGQPAWREVPAGREPQALMEANATQRNLVACAHGTPSAGHDRCAAWVERAFARLGVGVVGGDAVGLYDDYCHLVDTRELKVGMIVATSAHPYGVGGRAYGHVGLYVGDERVMDCLGDRVRTVPLDLWLSAYGVMAEPRWGWLGSIGLG